MSPHLPRTLTINLPATPDIPKSMHFTRKILAEVWNPVGPGQMNTLLTAADFNGDGFVDLAVAGRHGHIVWLQNPADGKPSGNWQKHLLAEQRAMECGGTAFPVRGKPGFADLINGSEGSADAIYWWANPHNDGPWSRYLIAQTGFKQIHDTTVGEVGGQTRLFFTNQGGPDGARLWTVPIPQDPTRSPWPDLELIADQLYDHNPYKPKWFPDGRQPVEGIAAGDIDGDGDNEIICGTRWFKLGPNGWTSGQFASNYVTTKVLIADVDGDGLNEVVLSEGDATLFGFPDGCKCAWFKPQSTKDLSQPWTEHLLMEGMQDAHTLKAGPIMGSGRIDLLLGEIGQGDWETGQYAAPLPRLWVLENKGNGSFQPHLLDEGTGAHDSALLDLRNTGQLDIVLKPLHGPHKWHIIALYLNP
jgi:hypothetical protein